MRRFLLYVIFLGTIAGISTGYLGLTARSNAIEKQKAAWKQTNDALTIKKGAEEKYQTALKIKSDAELKSEAAKKERDDFEKAAQQAKENELSAKKEKEEAEQYAIKESKMRIEMQQKMNDAIKQAEASKQEMEMALGKAEAAEIAKNQAEERLAQTIIDLQTAQKEVAEIKEISDSAKKIAQFVSSVSGILFSELEMGDDHFKEGLETFNSGKTLIDKSKALNLISEGGKKYDKALTEISKIPPFEHKNSILIMQRISSSITANIKCIKITTDFLNSVIQNNDPPSDEQRFATYLETRKIKEQADRNITEACEMLMKMADEAKDGFTPSNMEMIKKTKKSAERRWLPENSAERKKQLVLFY